MSKPRVPSYRLHKPTGLAVVRLNGKDFYLGKHGIPASHDEYKRLIAEWLAHDRRIEADGHSTASVSRSDLTINELLVAYWGFATSYYVKNGKPTGEQQALKYAMRPLAELYGRTRITDFSPVALKAVRETMIDAGLARTLINARIKRIRRVFKWGVENQLVGATLLQGLQAVASLKRGRCNARETEPVKPAPDQHVDAVLGHVSRQVRAMIELQRLTGMRPCEVTMIRSGDLEINDGIWIYRPASHKTDHHGHKRVIYLGPKAQQIIKPFLKVDLTSHLFSPKDARNEYLLRQKASRKTPMTPSQARRRPKANPKRVPSERYTTGSYGHAIAKACMKLGIPRWSPNQLRHNAATFLRKEYGIDAARVILGHSSADTTEIYAELDHAKAREIMREVG
ncbi:MAG: recombinase XerD [Phycisphaeraceae bacterium]|nr:recombinase XerD [Phycisphaeraceae bacterium]